eukprot:2398208-Amphidinium_carterae.1
MSMRPQAMLDRTEQPAIPKGTCAQNARRGSRKIYLDHSPNPTKSYQTCTALEERESYGFIPH